MSFNDPTIIFSYLGSMLLWLGNWWWLFKIFSFIISTFLIFGIIKYISRPDYFYEKREYGLKKSWDYKKSYKNNSQKIWDGVLKKVQNQGVNQLISAVKSADELLVDTLHRAGYKGFNADQIFAEIGEENIQNIKELKSERADILSKMNNDKIVLDIKDVKRLLRLYRIVLQSFGVIE